MFRNTTKIGCETMSKIVGWNIFTEEENENGEIELVAWNISSWLASVIEEEFEALLEYMASEEE